MKFSDEISNVAAIAANGGPRPSDDLLQRWVGCAQQLEALYSSLLEGVLTPGQFHVVKSIDEALGRIEAAIATGAPRAVGDGE